VYTCSRRLCQEGIPLFIIHSTDDETTPIAHARRIKAACPEASLWKIEGYEHAGAYAHPEYRQRILSFLRTGVLAEETQRRSESPRPRVALSSSSRDSLVALRDLTL